MPGTGEGAGTAHDAQVVIDESVAVAVELGLSRGQEQEAAVIAAALKVNRQKEHLKAAEEALKVAQAALEGRDS